VPYWGREGPELLEQRFRTYAEEDQTLVFGANTYRLMARFARRKGPDVRAAQRGPKDRDLPDAGGAADLGESPPAWWIGWR
jgi:hypothetical protein